MKRYIVDERAGCAAVRDTHHKDYESEGNGLHSDFASVVEYVSYHNNHKGDGGDFEEQDERIKIKFLNDICSLLNFKHQTETPEQKAERERLEFIKLMCETVAKKCGSPSSIYEMYCAALYDSGYRKAK